MLIYLFVGTCCSPIATRIPPALVKSSGGLVFGLLGVWVGGCWEGLVVRLFGVVWFDGWVVGSPAAGVYSESD